MTDWADRAASRFMLDELEPLPGRGPHAQERLAALLRWARQCGVEIGVTRAQLSGFRSSLRELESRAEIGPIEQIQIDAKRSMVEDLEGQLRDLEGGGDVDDPALYVAFDVGAAHERLRAIDHLRAWQAPAGVGDEERIALESLAHMFADTFERGEHVEKEVPNG